MSVGDGFFATTRWTLVRAAGRGESPQVDAALESLCTAYWFPLYAYVRRHGFAKEDAEDLTQAFFARLLARRDFAGLREENGRFRAFLLAALKNFLANERDRAGRLKRGGAITHLSLDWQSADTKFEVSDNGNPSPDEAYDREWAVALLERVILRLREECVAEGRAERFEQLKDFLTTGRGEISHAERAAELGMEEGTLRAAVHRLRKRYRELLRREVGDTLADPAMVEEELAVLLGAFT
ncbi:sigma-70 family RNA polymerase sigma factor [Luteolibacter yonseiensis]|uniref:Sigma-70 family RNA polymerase sigma factor n=1 Tax=Luteolibacter yonseiensis TaxID=1144680 RepID=A0A934V865_9BACT|nr:sigma-70 family RNA polymerase sigma factor [Luteolibacter yonseiensis]MBK1816922.1 sigma-70 family RNA polymerase sigma factor [Luteolibacter yonseiensis]